MLLRKLTLNNFKNYEEAEIVFSEKLNCFIGHNGAGKTNLLDAIYYLAFCKSYFAPNDRQNIRYDQRFFAIHGDFLSDSEGEFTISCSLKEEGKKSFKLNKKEYDRLSDHIGRVPLVMISPYDSDLINDGSELRRKFLDGVISQFDSNYLDILLRYNKALLQRNTLLKNFYENHFFDSENLALWDEQLVMLSEPIHQKRAEFLKEFLPIFQKYYVFVSGGDEKVEILYESQLDEKTMRELLAENSERDRYALHTTAGIHKDDLIFLIDQHPVKRFGSQGQQKSFVVAIKLAQFDLNYKKLGQKPLLLLDDIFDKLDAERVKQLVDLVGNNHFGQVFITDTHRDRVERLFNDVAPDHHVFMVEKGHVK